MLKYHKPWKNKYDVTLTKQSFCFSKSSSLVKLPLVIIYLSCASTRWFTICCNSSSAAKGDAGGDNELDEDATNVDDGETESGDCSTAVDVWLKDEAWDNPFDKGEVEQFDKGETVSSIRPLSSHRL